MPSESPISPRMAVISFSDLLPKFLVLSSSDSVFCTRSPMVPTLAVFRQLEDRTDRSSSATLWNRNSLTALRTGGSAASLLSAGGLAATSISRANWLARMREASATAVSGVTPPLVQTSRMSRSCEADGVARLSTWKFARLTGEHEHGVCRAIPHPGGCGEPDRHARGHSRRMLRARGDRKGSVGPRPEGQDRRGPRTGECATRVHRQHGGPCGSRPAEGYPVRCPPCGRRHASPRRG